MHTCIGFEGDDEDEDEDEDADDSGSLLKE